jgi:hypothetical protein
VRTWTLVGCALLAACGRLGFDPASSTASDATIVPADAAACAGAVAHLAVDTGAGGTWVTSVRGRRTARGFSVTYVAPDGVGFALSAAVDGAGNVSELVADTNVDTGPTLQVDAVALGPQVLVASMAAARLSLRPYDLNFAAMGQGTTRPNRHGVIGPLAASGDGAVVAMVDTGATAQVDGRLVDATGADQGASRVVITASEAATEVRLDAIGPGFLVTWLSNQAVRAEVLDDNLQVLHGPRTLSAATPAYEVASAWAAHQHRSLVVWVQPRAATTDVWGQLVDDSLTPISAPMMLRADATVPKVGSDGDSFWVVWSDQSAATLLSGAHITTDGATTTFALPGSGGTEVDHDVVGMPGAAEVLWFERGGTIANALWAVPACTLGT